MSAGDTPASAGLFFWFPRRSLGEACAPRVNAIQSESTTRAVPAVFESYVNKLRGAKVQRLKSFYHDYEKNNFSINDARSCFACSPAGARR